MSSVLSWAIPVFLVLMIAGPIFHYLRRERRRTQRMEQAAKEMGLSFARHGPPDIPAELSRFNLFSEGRYRRISHLMKGQADGVEVQIFDYRFTYGSDDSVETPTQTVICFRVPGLDLPAFSLRPRFASTALPTPSRFLTTRAICRTSGRRCPRPI